ncbi:MAG: DUF6335 family protein [Vicinamibacterales bacterium]
MRKPIAKAAPTKIAPQRATSISVSKQPQASGSKPRVPRPAGARKVPALNRARRTLQDNDDIVQSPPSTLDLDRTASSVRSGRKAMRHVLDEHTETSPTLTAGDVDADWQAAYSVGDEAPGGDNPTPDQDIVDDIGKALGVQYEDSEELKGEKKISDRDRKRWELDPASAEDYGDHEED